MRFVLYRNLGSLEGKMTKLQKGLSQVDNKVSKLKKTFEERTTEAAKLKVELEKEQETIEAAENLVGKLEGEYQRWNEQVRFYIYYYACSSHLIAGDRGIAFGLSVSMHMFAHA